MSEMTDESDRELSARMESSLCAAAAEWDQAMLSNDAEGIGRYMAESWRIIGADGGITDRSTFLAQIRDGRLSHHTMTTEEADVQIFSSVGILVARGVSAGVFEGHAFRVVERQSNVFVHDAGRWQCVLTHLSPLAASHS